MRRLKTRFHTSKRRGYEGAKKHRDKGTRKDFLAIRQAPKNTAISPPRGGAVGEHVDECRNPRHTTSLARRRTNLLLAGGRGGCVTEEAEYENRSVLCHIMGSQNTKATPGPISGGGLAGKKIKMARYHD